MKTKVLFITIAFTFLELQNIFSQEWIRIYGDSTNTKVKDVAEQYDKGVLFSGSKYANAYFASGWLMKSDINGYRLWEKLFSIPNKFVKFYGAVRSDDGGVVEIGVTNKQSSTCYDPFIVKTNTCFEKEWCRIFNSSNCDCDGLDIQNTSDGGYMALIGKWKYGEEQKIWLFRLDSLGEVIWAQVYATDPEWNLEWPYSIEKTTDNCFVITGETYYPDPTYPNEKIIKIILIKVNLNGGTIFEVPWGTDNGVYSRGYESVEDNQHNIYTASEHARRSLPVGVSPCIFKTSSTGEPIDCFDLLTTSVTGISTTINWFQDSSLILGTKWGYLYGVDTIGVFKSNNMGTVLKSKSLITSSSGTLQSSDITFNNKVVIAGSFFSTNNWQPYAFKLTSDLEYDSVYTTPFTYDSLCPHPIVSDTIPLDDCEVVVVGIDDPEQHPEKTKLHVYPNPASQVITVEMPQYLIKTSGGSGITATTYYHQWKSVRLDVFDLFGKLMYSQDIPGKTEKTELDISSWPVGMYIARIVFMNEVTGTVKFVKE